MSSWSSYPSIFALGHKAIKGLLGVDVNVEEKVDGSQFSFGKFAPAMCKLCGFLPEEHPADHPYTEDDEPEIKVRSKGAVMHLEAPESLFKEACHTVKTLAPELHLGWTYRGEVLKKPKHNALAYDRTPRSNIIIFDINTGPQEYLSYVEKKVECGRLGLEVVPLLFSGHMTSIESFRGFLATESILGGQKIEGVVVKPREYNLFGLDKKVLMGKFVSEAFKEVHRKAWGESNPTSKDIFTKIRDMYCTPARWQKAIIHLREQGLIQDDVRDIGQIIKVVPEDVLKEEEDSIKETLFKFAWPHIRRGLTYGLPDWYKEILLKRQFETEKTSGTDSDSDKPVETGTGK